SNEPQLIVLGQPGEPSRGAREVFVEPGRLSSACQTRRVVFFFKQKTAYDIGLGIPAEPLFRSKTTNLTSKEAKMGKVMRHTLGASLNIRHNLSSSKGPKPLQLKLLTTYIPKTSAFTLAFSTSQRLRTTRASARTFFTFRH